MNPKSNCSSGCTVCGYVVTVVAAVAVGVQRPGETYEQAFGDIACAGRVILEQHDGRLGAGAHLCPELGLRFRCLAGLFEDLHGGLVHQQVGPFDELIAQHVDERHHERSDAHHPPRKRGARELNADALELLALAIQRQRIRVLRRGDAGEQSGAGEALGEGYVRAQAWRDASLERCPNHPHGGCSFARHGTYARKTARGTRIARWYCPESHTTFSLLPDCLAARLPGTLDEVEQVVAHAEQAPSRRAAAGCVAPRPGRAPGSDALGRAPGPAGPSRPDDRHRPASPLPRPVSRRDG